MIVPMKKTTLLMGNKDIENTLEKLRSLGVVHIQNVKTPISEDISILEKKSSDLEKTLNYLETQKIDTDQITNRNSQDIVDECIDLIIRKERLKDELEEEYDGLNWYEIWGDIKWADIEEMKKHGYYLRLYSCDQNIVKSIPEDKLIIKVNENKHSVYLVQLSHEKEDKLELKEEFVPERPLSEIRRLVNSYEEELKDIADEEKVLGKFHDHLMNYKDELDKSVEFANVKAGLGEVPHISYLNGYCPENQIEELKKLAENSGWGYMLEEPDENDNPPTKLQNKNWVKLIQPVFDFLGTVPGYREYDISQYFLIFFSIYFAMIIGDAGYGFIFLALSIFGHSKFKKPGQPLPLGIKLFYLVSTTTIIWGAVTGNWFGAKEIAAISIFKSITIPQIATFPELFPDMEIDPQQKVMFICFVLALIQLGLANIMNIIKELPGLKSIAHVGWLSLTAGLFLLVLQLVLSKPMPSFAPALMGIGLGLIVVFGNQEKDISFMKGLTTGFGGAFTTFLDSISTFSNIISYIRLFAVGMASVAIASSFNGIAAPMLKGFAFPAGLLVLIVGHGLNIVMGMLSVVVHGIRLNMLEFSGQLGIEWSGYEYKPFKNKNKGELE